MTQELAGLFLGAAADLTDHDDAVGVVVSLRTAFSAVDEVRAVDRVAADADARRLADAAAGELPHGLVGQRAGAADTPTRPGLWM